MTLTMANGADCDEVRGQCNQIIGAFEKEIEMKDLLIQEQKNTLRLVEQQRDMAYEIAEANPNLFDKVLLGVTGVGVGCAAMAEDTSARLICLAGAMVACALGGC